MSANHFVDFDEGQRAAWHPLPVVELEMNTTVECIMTVLADPKFWELDSRNTVSDVQEEAGVCRYIRHTGGKLGLINIRLKVWTTQRISGREMVCHCFEEYKEAMVWIRFTVEPLPLDAEGHPVTRVRIEERASNNKFLLFLGKGKLRKVRVYLLNQLKLRCESLRDRNTAEEAAAQVAPPHFNEPVPPGNASLIDFAPEAAAVGGDNQGADGNGDGDGDDDENMCCVCWENPIEVAFLPCGHLCVCQICGDSGMSECPICRGPITSSTRIFSSGV